MTVGAVVVPQGMAYAKLALLPPQFGLYSSFVGVIIYFLFATSKDITIGPVAVMSALTGNIISDVMDANPALAGQGHVIASALALISGSIIFFFGMVRLGFIVDFIPLPAIAAFMTGSALNIAMGQVPVMFGNGGTTTSATKPVYTRDPTYLVFGNFWKYIGHSTLDAAFGLTALFALYLIRYVCERLGKRYPRHERAIFFVNTLRTVFIILLYTMISWLVNRNHPTKPIISILSTVPRGLQNVGVPRIDKKIVSAFGSQLPSAVIVLLIEHIAIAKSFGRVNNYLIDPNQELIAIGITNIFGPFFGAYPATGSFSRTAIKAKAGVRTPLAGLITGAVVILAIYVLPPVFFYIPNASLAAVIIHAVGDLIAGPKSLKQFWIVSPVEFFIFWAGVIVTIFSTIEFGIYTTIATSGALLLFRLAKAKGAFVGPVKVYGLGSESLAPHNLYIPLDHSDGSNPAVTATTPGDGIFIYRFNEGLLYPNINHFTEHMVAGIIAETRPGQLNPYGKLGDRPWNVPGPRKINPDTLKDDHRPFLRAVILDFQGVPHLDVTGLQNLIDVRGQLDRHAGQAVPWHFANISSPWIRRALASAGFGKSEASVNVFSVSNIGTARDVKGQEPKGDIENAAEPIIVPVHSLDRPYFHSDLDEAMAAVYSNDSGKESSQGSKASVA